MIPQLGCCSASSDDVVTNYHCKESELRTWLGCETVGLLIKNGSLRLRLWNVNMMLTESVSL